MNKQEVSTKLLRMIKELSQLETNEIELMLAIFKKKIKDRVNDYMRKISEDFSVKCEYYGKSHEELREIREEILGGYEREFSRISDRLQEQYVNLILELQEIQSNQKIALTNYKKMLDAKAEVESSREYISYKNNFNNWIEKRELAKDQDAVDKCDMALLELKNPVIIYEEKIDSLIEKYGNYCGLEIECYRRLEECSNSVEMAIDSVMKYDLDWLDVPRKHGIFSTIKKLLNKVFSGGKFEREFLRPTKEKIRTIRKNTDVLIENIRDNTVKYIDTLNVYKNQIKQASNNV